MMLNILEIEKPTHLCVAFDVSRESFRTIELPEYKGTRGETPPEFLGQVPLLQDALHAMNIATITKEDYEADDIIASYAKAALAQGWSVTIVSSDRMALGASASISMRIRWRTASALWVSPPWLDWMAVVKKYFSSNMPRGVSIYFFDVIHQLLVRHLFLAFTKQVNVVDEVPLTPFFQHVNGGLEGHEFAHA